METTYTTKAVQEHTQEIEQKEKTLADELILTIDAFGIRATRYELIAAYISGMVRGSIVGDLITNEALFARCVEVKSNLIEQRTEYFVTNEMLHYLQRISDVKMGGDDA